MGGFFGAVSKHDAISDVFFGADYHSHLGTKRGGLAMINPDGIIKRVIHDISNAQFRTKFDSDISKFSGNCGIGVISDLEDQPLVIGSHLGIYAIVTVGKLNNIEELTRQAIHEHHVHFAELSSGEYNSTEVVASLINTQDSIEKGIAYAQEKIKGSCSIMLMMDGMIYAARDKFGRTPVVIGKKDGSFAVTMESSAFPNLDYKVEKELGPGEIVRLSMDCLVTLKKAQENMQMCSFFWIYFGYPSSCYEGKNTETVRYRNGELMAEADDVEIDSVCGIPDSGIAHAIGFSNKYQKPYLRGLVKYTPTWSRSFIPQNQGMRDLVAKMKLIPVDEQISNRKLLFCDDSIVRGTQFKAIAKRLYERGAEEVHLRSACPPLTYPCPFLNFSRSKSVLDLAARRVINTLEGCEPAEEILQEYTTAGTPRYE